MESQPSFPPKQTAPPIAPVNEASWGGGAAARQTKGGRPTGGKICQLIPFCWENIRQPAPSERKWVSIRTVFNDPTPASDAPYTTQTLQTRLFPSRITQAWGGPPSSPPQSGIASPLLSPQWARPLSTKQLDGRLTVAVALTWEGRLQVPSYHCPLPNPAEEGRPPGL